MFRNRWVILALTAIVLLGSGGSWLYYLHKHGVSLVKTDRTAVPLDKVKTVSRPKDSYDAIVVGTDPEGVAAAVSAAKNGLKTLLVDGRDREILGGLMTIGWLNTIDLNQDKDHLTTLPGQKPAVLNKGIFQAWFDQVEGTSFDVTTAANAFNKLVKDQPNIDVALKMKAIDPLVADGQGGSRQVQGAVLTLADGSKMTVRAKSVIDATQDADFAAAAGVGFTFGREDLGSPKDLMAVTVVFRLKNADDAFWKQVQKRMADDGDPDSGADEHSAWGFGEMQKYQPVNAKETKMRGLNVGRQNDNTILINALQIFGIDPLDPQSRQKAFDIAKNELPHIVDYMKKIYPEFTKLELESTAPELYVRESRHMQGLYRLSILDVLDNKDQWDRIAFGSYRVDLQRISPQDNGLEVLSPYKYAVPFRSIVPKQVDGLLVVGRAASYDSLAHGSARVIPVGMAEGEAAGAAAKIAMDKGVTFRTMADNKELIANLQNTLNAQGMDLKPYTLPKLPMLDYMKQKTYPGLRAAVYLGQVGRQGDNDFKLDAASNPQRFVNLFQAAKRKYPQAFKADPAASLSAIADPAKQPLTAEQAASTIAKAAGLNTTAGKALEELQAKGIVTAASLGVIADKQNLTNGESYMLLKDALESLANVRF